MRVRHFGGITAFAAIGVLSFTTFARPVLAEDGKPAEGKPVDEMTAKVTELEVEAKKHIADKSDDAMTTDIATAVKLYGQVSEKKLKARLILVVGGITLGTSHDPVEKVAIKAFGDMADPTGFRFIRSFVVQRNPDDNPPLMIDAIAAASKMKSDESVPVLMTLVEKSHVMPVASAAMQAFSTFGENKSTRMRILSQLIETVKKDRPGVGWRWSPNGGITGAQSQKTAPTKSGEDTVNRYQALAGVMNETCNKMTGQNVGAPEEWFDMKDNYKSDLGRLFLK